MPAVLVPTPNQLVFGDVYVGTVATATATWKSTSQAAATVTGLAVQGPNAAQVTWTAAAPLANVQVTSTQATPVVTFSLRGGLLPGRGARAPVLSRSRGPAVIYGSVEIVGIH